MDPLGSDTSERVGSLAWTRRTQGSLTASERRRLVLAILKAQGTYVAGRLRLLSGRVPAAAQRLSVADVVAPDSDFCRGAEAAALEQSPGVLQHGYRTWLYGNALATLDGVGLDPEHFYVSCLLHDYGIDSTVPGQDFTLRSAERALVVARANAIPEDVAERVADAITVHATPGISVDRDGALGTYVQLGAMYDLAGLRAGDLPRSYRDEVNRSHPRDGVTAAITSLIKAEIKAVPDGRFALLGRCGLVPLIKMAPHRPR